MRYPAPASVGQLKNAVPAVFSTEPHCTMLNQYEFVPTERILEAFLDHGYAVSRASQVEARSHSRRLTGKHILCFRKADQFDTLTPDHYIPEIVFTGSHDGSSAMHFFAGLFRIVCSNGMMVGEKWGTYRILHKRGAEVSALAAAGMLMEQMPIVAKKVAEMKQRSLKPAEEQKFALEAQKLRYPEHQPFAHSLLLQVRRADDAGNNLWQVMNRIQENLLKGGITYSGPKGRVTVTKGIERITKDVDINRGIWDLAEEFLA